MDPYVADIIKVLDKNKALAAFVYPFVVAVLTAVANWIVSGEFSTNEIRIAAAGLILSTLAALGAYLTPSNKAVVNAIPPVVQEPAKLVEP